MTLVHFPSQSSDDRDRDLYALAPAGVSNESALDMANRAVLAANIVDRNHVAIGEDPPLCVEDHIRRALTAQGFQFMDESAGNLIRAIAWDGDHALS